MQRRWKLRNTRTGEEMWVPDSDWQLIEAEEDPDIGAETMAAAFTGYEIIPREEVPAGEVWIGTSGKLKVIGPLMPAEERTCACGNTFVTSVESAPDQGCWDCVTPGLDPEPGLKIVS